MRKDKNNIIYLNHILEAIEKINNYIEQHSYQDFSETPWDQDALARNLEIIGEAAKNIDESIRDSFSEVPWREIIDFRNVVVHDYADLDLQVVWNIATKDLQNLKKHISIIVNKIEKD